MIQLAWVDLKPIRAIGLDNKWIKLSDFVIIKLFFKISVIEYSMKHMQLLRNNKESFCPLDCVFIGKKIIDFRLVIEVDFCGTLTKMT
jgi:hypothetical protein